MKVVRAEDEERADVTDSPMVRSTPGLPASVVHELRTPLTSIHGYAQVLQRSMQNEQRAANALSVIVRESTRLSAMLSQLAELADFDDGDVLLDPIDVDVHQVLDGVVHEVMRRDDGAHEILLTGSAVARCHPTILSQAVIHVLTNAVRYSDPGSEITVAIRQLDSMVEVLIGDRGIGIDPRDGERVYEAFERGCNAREAGVRGIGLGLFLARRAVRQAGGKIEHRPREHGGTMFRLTVPLS